MDASILLGLGSSVDYEISWSTPMMEALVHRYRISAEELQAPSQILDERTLVLSVLTNFAQGVGAEVHVGSPDIVQAFAAKFEKKVTLGGTTLQQADLR